ncbi:MAG: hypothetical protein SGI73_21370 [Chloroflexota bacterium]|nr:hypothetical protein [Chloroflexota bacterium]
MTDDANRVTPPTNDEPDASLPLDVPLPYDDGTNPRPAEPRDAAASEPSGDPDFGARLERLGGEPAPAITPEEFARLQRAGQVHIDARGRVRSARRSDAEAGVSLTKRRAWYTP